MRRFLILALPLLLIAAIETLLRFGMWEPLAEPRSYAGRSIEVKRELLSSSLSKLDFVTLGNSRPGYGIDHERLADAAGERDMVHANLSLPGTHWMTIGVLSDWLEVHHPEIQGGLIGLAAQELAYPGNGYYELGIVQPFRADSNIARITAHNPFELARLETFGSRLSLFAWREDIRDFIAHPISRLNRIRKRLGDSEAARLFVNPDMPGDMCKWGLDSLASCDAVEYSDDSPPDLRSQCTQVRATLTQRPRYTELRLESPTPEFMTRTRELVHTQLRSMKWPIPPVIILMPTARIWRSEGYDRGLQEWALDILRPLEEDGTIQLIDASDFFDSNDSDECKFFGDYYHQNALGRRVFFDWLLPKIESLLHARVKAKPFDDSDTQPDSADNK